MIENIAIKGTDLQRRSFFGTNVNFLNGLFYLNFSDYYSNHNSIVKQPNNKIVVGTKLKINDGGGDWNDIDYYINLFEKEDENTSGWNIIFSQETPAINDQYRYFRGNDELMNEKLMVDSYNSKMVIFTDVNSPGFLQNYKYRIRCLIETSYNSSWRFEEIVEFIEGVNWSADRQLKFLDSIIDKNNNPIVSYAFAASRRIRLKIRGKLYDPNTQWSSEYDILLGDNSNQFIKSLKLSGFYISTWTGDYFYCFYTLYNGDNINRKHKWGIRIVSYNTDPLEILYDNEHFESEWISCDNLIINNVMEIDHRYVLIQFNELKNNNYYSYFKIFQMSHSITVEPDKLEFRNRYGYGRIVKASPIVFRDKNLSDINSKLYIIEKKHPYSGPAYIPKIPLYYNILSDNINNSSNWPHIPKIGQSNIFNPIGSLYHQYPRSNNYSNASNVINYGSFQDGGALIGESDTHLQYFRFKNPVHRRLKYII